MHVVFMLFSYIKQYLFYLLVECQLYFTEIRSLTAFDFFLFLIFFLVSY